MFINQKKYKKKHIGGNSSGEKIGSLKAKANYLSRQGASYSELYDLCCLSSCPFSEMSQLSKIAAGVTENQRHREANLQFNMRHSQQSSCLLVQSLGNSDLSPRSWQINYFLKLILKCLKEGKGRLMMYPDNFPMFD